MDRAGKASPEKMSDKKKRKITIIPRPPREEIIKIKHSMNLRSNDPLPRCHAQNTQKAKKLGEAHQGSRHICGECQCSHVAGYGTEHYGTGYCVYHENAKKYKGQAKEVAHAQKVAVQQGYPDKVYKYLSDDKKFSEIREAAEAAQGRHELREEIVVLRAALQKYINQLDDKDTISDDNINSLARLTVSIAKLAKVELSITNSDYIHKDEVKGWLYSIMRMLQEEIKDVPLQQKILQKLVLIPQPKEGQQ
jgi:hypothetical protein